MSDKITEALASADSAQLRKLAFQGRVDALGAEVFQLQKQIDAKQGEAAKFKAEAEKQDQLVQSALDRLSSLGVDRSDAEKMVDMRVKLLAPKIDVSLPSDEKPAAKRKPKPARSPSDPAPVAVTGTTDAEGEGETPEPPVNSSGSEPPVPDAEPSETASVRLPNLS